MYPPRGTRFEELVESFVVDNRLLRDFVYLRPRVSNSQGSRELSDLLIVLNEECIPVQLKVQGELKARSRTKLASWVRKEAMTAGRQVSGAIRKITGAEITARHPTQGDVNWKSGILRPTHGLAVVEYLGPPVKLTSEARHVSPTGIPIHYFAVNDLFNVVELCGSLPDLVAYLEQRHQLAVELRSLVGAEKDLFGRYLLDGDLRPDLTVQEVIGSWALVMSQERGEFQRRQTHDIFVRFYNRAIEELHNRDPEIKSYTPSEFREAIRPREERAYLRMASVLNRVPYADRREIGKRIFQAAKMTKTSGGQQYFYVLAPDEKWVLVIMVSGNENRTERIKSQYTLLLAVLHKTGRKNAIGVVYPPLNSSLGFEFLLLEDFDVSTLRLGELAKGVPSSKPIPVTLFPQPSEDVWLPKEEDFMNPNP